jgi:hypothetical protein
MSDFVVNRKNIAQTKFIETEAAPLRSGQALLAVEKFALTANTITYGVAGDMIGYWKFFPTLSGWGKVPAWGIATVAKSNDAALAVGDRFYGYFPMSHELVVSPERISSRGFTDGATHRAELPVVYNQYSRVTPENGFDPAFDNHKMVYTPLFTTSFILDDFFADNNDFGATTVVIGSASSKTAFGLAFILKQTGRVKTVGLTSAANLSFVQGLGLYDSVKTYDEIESIEAGEATAYVDMSGNKGVLARVHTHFSEKLVASCGVGITHWRSSEGRQLAELPGAKPQLFFAPTQIVKRIKEWGPAHYQAKLNKATEAFFAVVDSWVEIEEKSFTNLSSVYDEVLNGAPANRAYIVAL